MLKPTCSDPQTGPDWQKMFLKEPQATVRSRGRSRHMAYCHWYHWSSSNHWQSYHSDSQPQLLWGQPGVSMLGVSCRQWKVKVSPRAGEHVLVSFSELCFFYFTVNNRVLLLLLTSLWFHVVLCSHCNRRWTPVACYVCGQAFWVFSENRVALCVSEPLVL